MSYFNRNDLLLMTTKLSNNMTVGEYLDLEDREDKVQIAEFIYSRFSERYIDPIDNIPINKKNGFCIMANSCLLIESLEAFYQGWETTNRRSRKAFELFFERVDGMKIFKKLNFYKNIRCGILHEGETKGGFKIHRDGPLFNSEKLIINANEFFKELKNYLRDYKNKLKTNDWDSEIWINLRNKMNAIIKNCMK